jgi:hypothetical protein
MSMRSQSYDPWVTYNAKLDKTIEILVLERVCLSYSCKHFGQKNSCKKSADLHPRQGIYYIGTFLQSSIKPLFYSQNRVETSRKKFARFFSTRVFQI